MVLHGNTLDKFVITIFTSSKVLLQLISNALKYLMEIIVDIQIQCKDI